MKIRDIILEGLKNPKDNPCWKGYHPVGTKKKNVRTVPNCVPESTESSVLDKHFGTDPGPEVAYDKQEIRALLTKAMGKIPAKQERILRMRFFQEMTLQQIAEKYGVTRDRIRQIVAIGLRKLQHPKIAKTLKGRSGTYDESAQQAAIAIAKKESGKYDKDGERIKEQGVGEARRSQFGAGFGDKFTLTISNGAKTKTKDFKREDDAIDYAEHWYETHGHKYPDVKMEVTDYAGDTMWMLDDDEQGVAEGGETGPKFTGYWKGKDKGKPGKKMVGDA